MNKRFDDFQIGDFAQLKHIITEEDVKKFSELTGDDNPLHIDRSFAKKTVFKDTVAHGMLSASFISTLVGKHIPGDGALWISQNFEFLLPVRIGDELTVIARVIEKHTSQHILVLETNITNQHKQTVVKGLGKVKQLEISKSENHPKPEESLEKVIIIIGGSRGIGAATAEYLLQKGYRVAITYSKDKVGAEEILASMQMHKNKLIAYQVDARDKHAIHNLAEKVINHFGTISGLVYCATGKTIAADFTALDWEDFQSHIDVQVQGAFHCAQAVLEEFIQRKTGAMVFLGSIYSDGAPPLKLSAYISAKAALNSLVRSLAVEYGPLGLRFNLVSPGMTETGLIADVPEKARLLAKMQIPLRRLAEPEDIAPVVEFLLSKGAAHITGETVRVCGGQIML